MGVESRSPPPASRRLRLAGRSLPGQRQLLAQAHWEPRLSLCTALSRPNPLFLPDIFHLLSPIFPHAAPPPRLFHPFRSFRLLPSRPPRPLPRRDPTRRFSSTRVPLPFARAPFSSLPISRRVANLFVSSFPFSPFYILSLSVSLFVHFPLHSVIATEYSIENRCSSRRFDLLPSSRVFLFNFSINSRLSAVPPTQ